MLETKQQALPSIPHVRKRLPESDFQLSIVDMGSVFVSTSDTLEVSYLVDQELRKREALHESFTAMGALSDFATSNPHLQVAETFAKRQCSWMKETDRGCQATLFQGSNKVR